MSKLNKNKTTSENYLKIDEVKVFIMKEEFYSLLIQTCLPYSNRNLALHQQVNITLLAYFTMLTFIFFKFNIVYESVLTIYIFNNKSNNFYVYDMLENLFQKNPPPIILRLLSI